jgi:hypothetical protein
MLNDLTGLAPAEVTRVICASVSRVQGSVMAELFEARNRLCLPGSLTNNVRRAMLYSSGWFVFWFEGQAEAVEEVLQRSARDPRNSGQRVIHRSRGPACLTEPISVATTQGADGPGTFERRIRQFERDMRQGVAQEPATVWQRLIAPCAIAPDLGYTALPDRYVALVSAEDNGPIDLICKLGERFGSPVVYQRFASAKSHSSDVGAAYVDLLQEQQVIRVHLLSRRALGHWLVRQTLAGLDGLVMLMGSRPGPAIDMAAGVADCINSLGTRPAIYQVTEQDEVAATIARLLHRAGAAESATDVVQLDESQIEDLLLGRFRQRTPETQVAYA